MVSGRNPEGALKRAFDVVVSILFLMLFAWLIALLAVLVRIQLGTPVFFVQERPGRGGRLFRLVKFRTMRNATDKNGEPLPDHIRMTKFGRFLRSTSLDELPELWNVIKGEMSLVGPRPLLPQYLARYSAEQARRHDVRPGITGWAQVNGRNAVGWTERFELDVWYVDNWSFVLDLKILWMTLATVFRRSGVSAAGHATMPEFTGNEPCDEDAGARCPGLHP